MTEKIDRKTIITKKMSRNLILIGLILGLYALLSVAFGGNAYYMRILTLASINVMLGTSLNLILGYTGQLNLGHAGFMAVGAYTAAILTTSYSTPFVVSLFLGALLAGFIGLLVGLPTLRLRGDYLAIATLGFAEIIRVTALNLNITGGALGIRGVPYLTNFTWAFFLAAITVWIIVNFINSSHGRACKAIREDEIAAEAMGVNTTYYKVLVFSMGAFFAGLAGGLFGHLLTIVHPSSFTFLKSIEYLVIAVVGGLGSITGSVMAAIFLTFLSEALRKFTELRMIIYAGALVLVMLLRPQGLMGGMELQLEHLDPRNWKGYLENFKNRQVSKLKLKRGDRNGNT